MGNLTWLSVGVFCVLVGLFLWLLEGLGRFFTFRR